MLEISERDIDKIEEIGEMEGSPVKMVKTTGGFYIAIGKMNGKSKPISTGSHPAICKYICSKYASFKPSLAKSEGFEQKVTDLSDKLDKGMVSSGYSMFSVQESKNTHSVVLNHRTIEIGRSEISVDMKKAEMSTSEFEPQYKEKAFRKYLYGAALDVAESQGAKEVDILGESGYTVCTVDLEK